VGYPLSNAVKSYNRNRKMGNQSTKTSLLSMDLLWGHMMEKHIDV
jgi:hypothetical protein